MYGVKIGDKHSYYDLGLILSSKSINTPNVQTSKVIVPMRDGAIDLTESISDIPKYENREIQMVFSVNSPMKTWPSKFSEIQNYLHGKRMRIIFDDDLAFYYIGRLSVNSWSSEKRIGKLVIDCDADPYKYDIITSKDDWEWDSFDFEESFINGTGEIIVNGTASTILICRTKRTFPTFTASNEMTVKYKEKTYKLKEGSQKIYDIFLSEGENELTFSGNGTVYIEYTGGSL